MSNVTFIRVLGIQSSDPSVIAKTDGQLVKWDPRLDWDCTCLTPTDEYECHHIDDVRAHLDPRITEPGGAA